MKKSKPRTQIVYTYGILDEMMASPAQPMPPEKRRHQLLRMNGGLLALRTNPNPTPDDWRVCADAVNIMETLVAMGEVEDTSGMLMDGVTALAKAGQRAGKGQPLRLDALGIRAVSAVLEDYAMVLEHLSHRTMVRAHRQTERRLYAIKAGKSQPHDVIIPKVAA